MLDGFEFFKSFNTTLVITDLYTTYVNNNDGQIATRREIKVQTVPCKRTWMIYNNLKSNWAYSMMILMT